MNGHLGLSREKGKKGAENVTPATIENVVPIPVPVPLLSPSEIPQLIPPSPPQSQGAVLSSSSGPLLEGS